MRKIVETRSSFSSTIKVIMRNPSLHNYTQTKGLRMIVLVSLIDCSTFNNEGLQCTVTSGIIYMYSYNT